MLKGKKILIGITGGIAAYKMPLLIRLLKQEACEVQVVMTPFAKNFVTALTLSTVSDNPVYHEFFSSSDGTWNSHVDFGRWADLFVIAPCTANTIGKMTHGITDNLLLATYMACESPVMIAPAMDVAMYRKSVNQNNLQILKSHGVHIIEPTEGELASGLKGPGRMEEPDNILQQIHKLVSDTTNNQKKN